MQIGGNLEKGEEGKEGRREGWANGKKDGSVESRKKEEGKRERRKKRKEGGERGGGGRERD